MSSRARLAGALLASALLVLVFSGCVGISQTNSSQPASMGPVTLSVNACANGAPGCSADANTGSVYEGVDIGNSSVEGQLLYAVRLPEGPTPPNQLTAALAGGGTLQFSRSPSYEAQLQALEPAPAGERWWGWLSAAFTYSESSKQAFSIAYTVNPPTLAEGPYPSPMRWRPVVGSRGVEAGLSALRPVVCGKTTEDLYDGYNETGSAVATVACIDSPDEAGARGFLGAPIIDFGITGTAVQAAPGSTVTATFLARRSGDPEPATSFSLAASTGVPGGSVAIDRNSVGLAGDSTNPVLATVTVPAGTPPGSYPVTLTATAPGKPTRTGTATVTVAGPSEGPLGLTASLNRKRFRAGTVKGKAAKGLPPVGAKLKLDASRAATLSIAVEKKQGKKGFKLVKPVSKSIPAGKSTIAIKGKLLSAKLTPGRYRLKLTASAGGFRVQPRPLTFTLVAG